MFSTDTSNPRQQPSVAVATLVGVLFLAFYAVTVPVSHSDAEDAYSFARNAREVPLAELFHARHLLYEPLARGCFLAMRSVMPSCDAFTVLRFMSSVSAAIMIALLFLLFQHRLRLPRDLAVMAACLVGVAHGVWRYAMTPEAYLPASLFLVVTLYVLTARSLCVRRALAAALLGSLTVLIHFATVFAVLPAFGWYLVQRRKYRCTVLYGITVVMCVVGAYLFAGLSPFGEGELEGLTALSEGGVGAIPRQLVKGCVGWLQTICAQDYLFCLPIVRTVVTKLFPARMLHEEMFAGIASGWRAAILPCCTFAGILVMVVLAGVRRLRCRISQPATDAESASLRRQLAWSMAVWWVAQAFLALVTQPGSPEVWVFAVLPLGIGLTAGMFAGHRVSFSVQTGLLLCLLALHNYVGGHLINSHEGGDYYAVRGKWVLENMRSEDMVLTADTAGYVRYLAYLAPGRVVDLYQIHPTNAPALIGGVIEDGGHVFASEQVFFALEPMRNRFPERHDCILDVGRQLFPEFRRVTTSPAGDTYQYHGVSTPLDQH